MALPPHNPNSHIGKVGATPQGPRYQHMPYGYWPRARRPDVRCGACLQQMEPTGNPAYPHEFKCPGECGGYVDVFPPRHVGSAAQQPAQNQWMPEKECGAMVHSVRCGKPIRWGDSVCDDCERRIVAEMWQDAGNRYTGRTGRRQYILDLVGNLAMQRERAKRLTKERNEKAAKAEAQRRARQDTSHHVVYYVKLGDNHIKIGTTGELTRRMVELRVVNANNLLAAEPGGPDVEKQRHQQFRKWRYSVRKEDFAEAQELLDHIENLRGIHGDPYTLAAELAQPAA